MQTNSKKRRVILFTVHCWLHLPFFAGLRLRALEGGRPQLAGFGLPPGGCGLQARAAAPPPASQGQPCCSTPIFLSASFFHARYETGTNWMGSQKVSSWMGFQKEVKAFLLPVPTILKTRLSSNLTPFFSCLIPNMSKSGISMWMFRWWPLHAN